VRKSVYKKTFTILVIIFISSCNPTKGIKYNELLLDNNKVFVNDTISNDINILSLIKQNPNSKPIGLGIPLRLYIHNLSKNDTLKSFKKISVNKFLKDIGEKPVIIDSLKTINSLKDIQSYYFSKGWFDVDGKFEIDEIKNGVILFGNEANGINPNLSKVIDKRLSIPRFGKLKKTESLNVANALSIVLSENSRMSTEK
jgi:hypothetical protein